jgi:adenylate cyclase
MPVRRSVTAVAPTLAAGDRSASGTALHAGRTIEPTPGDGGTAVTAGKAPRARDEAFWRDYLMNYGAMQARSRRFFNRLPADPRCQLCASPFAGPAGRVMRLVGKQPSSGNPKMCNACEKVLLKHHGGAEVPGAMLFADIRGSTALAETMSPGAFHDVLERFYAVGSAAVFANDGMVDKFVGDELVASFPPMLSGGHQAERAVTAGQAVLAATGHGQPGGPWVSVGAGVHVGTVWFGAVGDESHVEITVLGDAVNTAARLAAAAGPGELLVSVDAAAEAGFVGDHERRSLDLKGKQLPVEVLVVRAAGNGRR